ncbi:MAG: hypothetical protein HN729_06660 [Candidatus Marinimicrobia bacterium]|jgi:hypothetical protein|nr:hypothetical protein [Candidatus Neomarinimicrobiota bacterium]MBT3633697.1 hypothetical protein [Candidatus Neomarinimicrobiota bacterium]MBT3682350.1 hypothetical protein [Candidatus Neomarinimicrobiota bacterium]MBT3759114.1 hypothetical protein [Candidatus Neomarinimicrobiota bacterium]MBT3895613.1 hypothetical protein [Candidatus Neomarinimicrobiota bacterium]
MPKKRILSSYKVDNSNDLTDSISLDEGKKFGNSIIKGSKVILKKPTMILIPKNEDESESKANTKFQFEPIIDDQMISGLTVKCSCGNSSEVHFKYRKKG